MDHERRQIWMTTVHHVDRTKRRTFTTEDGAKRYLEACRGERIVQWKIEAIWLYGPL